MPHPRLASTTDIELANEDFQTDNHREAAEEILEFYDEGLRAFTDMAERGNWSRSLYQQVYRKYFRAITDSGASEPEALGGASEGARSDYRQGYRDGWSDAMDQLIERFWTEEDED